MIPFYSIAGKTLPTYGLMAVIGGLAGFLPVFFLARKRKLETENVLYLYALGVVGGLIGVAVYRAMIGALFGAALFFYYWSGAFKTDRVAYGSVLATGIPLAAFFLRLGCTAAGCCYGIETASPFHIIFHHSPFAPAGVPLLPTQPMEAAFHLLWFLLLFVPAAAGKQVPYNVLWYLASYGVYRFVIDFFRGDRGQVYASGFTLAQGVALLLTALALFGVRQRHRQARNSLTDTG